MGRGQRIKGSVFEREVMAAFSAALGQTFKRHIGQARDGGQDGIAGRWCIEAKRRASLKTMEGWLAQVTNASLALGPMTEGEQDYHWPVVVMRADNGKAMALLDFTDFLTLIKETE